MEPTLKSFLGLSGGNEEAYSFESAFAEDTAMEALDEISFRDNPVGQLAQYVAIQEQEEAGGELLSPEKLKELYGEDFTKPATARVGALISQYKQERRELERQVMQGPDTFAFSAKKLGAQLVNGIMDPINFAVGSLFGFGATALASKLGVSSAAGILGADVAGNIAGNVALEPLNVLTADKTQQDIDLGRNLLWDVAFGATPPLAFKGIKLLSQINPRASVEAVQAQLNRVAMGKSPDLSPVENALKADITGKDFMPYQHTDFSLDGRKLYSASPEAVPSFVPESLTKGSDDFPDGVLYFSDDPNVANGMAARTMSEVDGTIFEHNISQANLFDGSVLKAEGKTPEAIAAKAHSEGFDGFFYREERANGSPHNVVGMFDSAKAGEAKPLKPKRAAVPESMTRDEYTREAMRQLDPGQSYLDETLNARDRDSIQKIFDDAEAAEMASPRIQEDKRIAQETIAEIESELQYMDDPEIKLELDQIKKEVAQSDGYQKMIRAAASCVRS